MFYVVIFVVILSAQEPCGCLSYLPLLYVISAAVCLLVFVVITFASVYHVRITLFHICNTLMQWHIRVTKVGLLAVFGNPSLYLISFYIQCKWAKKKPPPTVPVYEEMSGVRPVKEKNTGCLMDITQLQDANSSVSALLSKENLYVRPESTKCEWGLILWWSLIMLLVLTHRVLPSKCILK